MIDHVINQEGIAAQTHLGKRKCGGQINQEVGFEVVHGNGTRVGDGLAAAEDPGTWGDESGAELHDHVEEVEEVGDGAEEGDEDAEAEVDVHAGGSGDDGEEEVERVDEHGEEAADEEDLVPSGHEVRSRVEDLVPPRYLLPQGKGPREVPEVNGLRRGRRRRGVGVHATVHLLLLRALTTAMAVEREREKAKRQSKLWRWV